MSVQRKLRKLLRSPKAFVADSPLFRSLRDGHYETTDLDELFDLSADRNLARDAGGRFAYLPWIAEHGDALASLIDPDRELLFPFPFFRLGRDPQQRGRINTFVRERPDLYRALVLRALAPARHLLAGVVFTLDWTPAMRQVAHVCRELNLQTVLVPHESVFADANRYYVDTHTGADLPMCDVTLCWGGLQRDIFVQRGYPESRIRTVGSPKLDLAGHYEPVLERAIFASMYGLSPSRPIVLFAMQPLDSQVPTDEARTAQNRAIFDLLKTCGELDAQLLVRCAPSGHALLSAKLRAQLDASEHAAIDEGRPYLVSPAEALHHSAAVVSMNSTMLLEGALMGRGAIRTHYLPFESLWDAAGIPKVTNLHELERALTEALEGGCKLGEQGRAWAAQAFSSGTFDNLSGGRIRTILHGLQSQRTSPLPSVVDHLFLDHHASCSFATASLYRTPDASMAHLPAMLGYRALTSSSESAAVADVFVNWGITQTARKTRHARLARKLQRPLLIVEDGFLRSVDIGLSGSAGLSIIVDTQTAYYDATRPSRLEDRLNGPTDLTHEQRARATACMASIREYRLSKYNHAPDTRRTYGNGPSILLVDQRRGDQSVASGLADESSFVQMLRDALARPGHTVLVKRHPDATRGGRASYFDKTLIDSVQAGSRLVLIDDEVNPHTLFDQVDEVFTVTSNMGMEALIAGLPVQCYGAPYYSGWGLTVDHLAVPRRTRQRDVVELFHFAYIEACRYYSPELGRAAEIEDLIAHLAMGGKG